MNFTYRINLQILNTHCVLGWDLSTIQRSSFSQKNLCDAVDKYIIILILIRCYVLDKGSRWNPIVGGFLILSLCARVCEFASMIYSNLIPIARTVYTPMVHAPSFPLYTSLPPPSSSSSSSPPLHPIGFNNKTTDCVIKTTSINHKRNAYTGRPTKKKKNLFSHQYIRIIIIICMCAALWKTRRMIYII